MVLWIIIIVSEYSHYYQEKCCDSVSVWIWISEKLCTFFDNYSSPFVKLVTCIFIFWFFIFVPLIFIIFSTWLLKLLMHFCFLSRFNTDTSVIHVLFLRIFQCLICFFHYFEVFLSFFRFIMIGMKLSCWFMKKLYLFSKIVFLIIFELL